MFVSQFRGVVARALVCSCISLAAISVAAADEAVSPAGPGSDTASMDRRSAPEPADPDLLDALERATPTETPTVPDRRMDRRGEMDAAELLSGFGRSSRRAGGEVDSAPAPDAVEQAIRERAETPLPVPKPPRPKLPIRGDADPDAEGESSRSSQTGQRQVFGTDDRVQITDTSPYPFRAFGQLLVEFPYKTSTCSGTLVSRRHVLTAAHCVYDEERHVWADEVGFIPGRNGKGVPHGYYDAAEWSIPSGYTNQAGTTYSWDHMRYDIAVVRLSSNAGDQLGWLAYGYDDNLPPFVGNIVGYPGDKPSGTMWRASCDVDPAEGEPDFLHSHCDTYPGSSGAAVYDYEPSTKGRLILGVNISENPSFNSALRITGPYFEWIRSFTQ